LTEAEREAAGQFLLSVALSIASSNGEPLGRETVRVLTTAYGLVGLPEELLFRRLHQQSLGDGDVPVIVRRGRAVASGHPLPRSSPTLGPANAAQPAAAPSNPSEPTGSPVRLRPSVVKRTMAQTEAVSCLLSGIFIEDVPTGRADTGQLVGLDQAHGSLLRELTTRSSWSRADLGELADRHGLLPNGALDAINEAALEITGEPVIEGDDELAVNDAVLREILS
jgi:hypothetical protein